MNAAIESKKAKPERLYQGVGVIGGRVTVDVSENYTINIEGETFRFRPTNAVRDRLTNHLKQSPDTEIYLRVYPVYNLNLHQISFTARKFYAHQPESTQINQFLLAGIWQYIPQLPDQPVMSIYRNSLRRGERIECVKTNHLPVRGFDEFVYHQQNSAKNPQKPKYYQLLVRLNPQQQIFEYLSLLFSSEDIPPYIKKKRNKKRKPKPKPSLPNPTKRVKQMNFTLLQQTAIKLREAGFFEGKVSGKGITSEALRSKVSDSLSNHPEAVKVLNCK